MNLKEKISLFIKKYDILEKGDSVLLGVSGGPDSVFMLYMLNLLKEEFHLSIAAAVFNHRLRKEATEECAFVKKICNDLHVDFFYGGADVRKTADKNKISVEEAAREERLKFLFETKERNNFNKIALAHNKNDFVETVLIHLAKGTGLGGLTGIRPVSFNGIVHPIICVMRSEIEQYLSEKSIPFRMDLTNYSLNYLRNRMRHQIVPLFASINENFIERIFKMGLLIAEEDNFLSDICEKDLEIIKTKEEFSLNVFLMLPLFEKRRIIKELLGEYADSERVDRIIDFLQSGGTSKMNLYGNLFLIKKENCFCIRKDKSIPFSLQASYELTTPGEAVIEDLFMKVGTSILEDLEKIRFLKYTAFFDLDKIPLPLKIRFREEGDRIKLENGTKKIQDLFTDLKIPKEKRPYTPLLIDGEGNIVWVIGVRRSALYKIDSSTKRVLSVRVSFMKKQFML